MAEPTKPGGYGLPPSGPHFFYMVAIRETLDRGEPQEIQALLDGAKQVREQYGDLDGLIRELETVAKPKIPPRPFYMVAVRETLARGDPAEISALLQDAKDVQSQYGGGLDALIADLEKASGNCG